SYYLPLLCAFFFFLGSLAHRDLHSFPTRRSSDLPLRMLVEKALEKDPAERFQSMRDVVVDLRRVVRSSGEARPALPATRRSVPRSEEHTSELQSRFDLVCRLLLEKKKKQIETPQP